jgi:Asp-tRNA(Asn)/Glu-tRNA(Gln) amidotransferase A subunit family amidase
VCADVVKDNYETIGLQSADGSKSLEGFVSDKDAFLVARIKAAGAIVIAKTNMAEFAFSPNETLSSIQGQTKNPYALDRVPAGSSGGTAAAVGGQPRDRRPRQRHRQLDSRSVVAHRARRYSDRRWADEPRGGDSAQLSRGRGGANGAHRHDAVTIFQVIAGEDPDDPMTARAAAARRSGLPRSLVPTAPRCAHRHAHAGVRARQP